MAKAFGVHSAGSKGGPPTKLKSNLHTWGCHLVVLCPSDKSPSASWDSNGYTKTTDTNRATPRLFTQRWMRISNNNHCIQLLAGLALLLTFVLYYVLNDMMLMLTGKFCGTAFLLSLETQPTESSQLLL